MAGDTTGLKVGDEAELILVVQAYQKVVCRCQIEHIEPNKARFGVKFLSKARIIKERPADPAGQKAREPDLPVTGTMLCPVDGKRFPSELKRQDRRKFR